MSVGAHSEKPLDAVLSDYLSRLLRRWAEATIVPRVSVAMEGWAPELNECHANVAKWVEYHAAHKKVHGWLIMDLRATALIGKPPIIDLLAHSVIENENGDLLDITPVPPESGVYPFLRHAALDSEYETIIGEYGLSRFRLHGAGLTPHRASYLSS
jgi:hypothetical protein